MKTTKEAIPRPTGDHFFNNFWDESWIYIKTIVDVLHEPVVVLSKDFHVLAANDTFYSTFKIEAKDTIGKVLYELGNGQWNIPALRELLEDILPQNTFFKNFEVTHDFPVIGHRQMILNARQLHFNGNTDETFAPIILLAMEDVTAMLAVAEAFAGKASELEAQRAEKLKNLELRNKRLEEELNMLKKGR